MKLEPKTVQQTFLNCLAVPSEITQQMETEARLGVAPAGYQIIEGVVQRVLFNTAKVEQQKQTIRELLNELPKEFQEEGGGGWSFLNACMDKDGRQWGEHINIDDLLCLGLAAGLVRFSLPREMWSVFPGGMPYFEVLTGHPAEHGRD